LTLVPCYSLLSSEVVCHFQILQSGETIIPNEAHFLLEECYSELSTPHYWIHNYFLPVEVMVLIIHDCSNSTVDSNDTTQQ